jgi:hypothetical protein
MADSATARKLTRPGASFARRYGLAFASVAGALLLDLLFHHFNLPHPFAAFALSAIAITFWYDGTKPGIVVVLLSSLRLHLRGQIQQPLSRSLSAGVLDLCNTHDLGKTEKGGSRGRDHGPIYKADCSE